MYKVKYLLDRSALYTLYCSLVLPYLNYCCPIWGNIYMATIKNVIILQKKAVRIIDQVSFRESTAEIFKKYKLLKFTDIVKLNTGMIMFKAKSGTLPRRLKYHFSINVSNTRQNGLFKIEYKRTKLKSFCVSHSGVLLWNNLASKIRNSVTLFEFKKRLKNYLINAYC